MSRRLTEKVIEAGIVPRQSVELLKMWRLIDPSTPCDDKLEEQTCKQLLDFVDQIAVLLEEETEMPEMKETMPQVTELFRATGQRCMVLCAINGRVEELEVLAAEDAIGCLYIRNSTGWVELFMRPGSQLQFDGKVREIVEVSPSYFGDKIGYYRCRTQGVPEHAQMRRLPEVGTSG
jgi:hypothetical protein